MSLETFDEAGGLYRSRGDEVNARRPLFTGDVFEDVPIPGVQDTGMGIIVAHPCAMRGPEAQLQPSVLMAAVRPHDATGKNAWLRGHYDKMPLPDLVSGAGGMHAAHLDQIGRASTADVVDGVRLGCLSDFGISLLQQRLVFHLTRFEVPTYQFYEASAHTIEEAEILEDWCDALGGAGLADQRSAQLLEAFLREDRGDGRSLQKDLREPQLRASVRSACRAEAARISGDPATDDSR